MPRHWLVKQEPTAYSWNQLLQDGKTEWTGVRNFQARNHLREMRSGDHVFFYHSVNGKAIQGIAEVTREAFPDPTATAGPWLAVEIKPVRTLARPVLLQEIKVHPALANLPLLKQSRLSVMPVSPEEYNVICQLAAKDNPAK